MIDRDFWHGRRIFITGHTGFKGSWLSLWLQTLGAEITGFSNGIPTQPSLFQLADASREMRSVEGDIRDPEAVLSALTDSKAEIVIHMAAQPLVRKSFIEPRMTYETNIMGTVNVLEAVRLTESVRAVVNVTSDKCYENREWDWGYREIEPMGGHDPYSSSKGASELVTSAYRKSFFSDHDGACLASARAGNVIGGGDWGEDRLVPDAMRATLAGKALLVRNPKAIRPWQHVLNPLSGYLLLAEAIWKSHQYEGGWNFGPAERDAQSVEWVIERLSAAWPQRFRWELDKGAHPHEAHNLKLDSSLARNRLGWRPLIDLESGLLQTVNWYRAFSEGEEIRSVTLDQIESLQKLTSV